MSAVTAVRKRGGGRQSGSKRPAVQSGESRRLASRVCLSDKTRVEPDRDWLEDGFISYLVCGLSGSNKMMDYPCRYDYLIKRVERKRGRFSPDACGWVNVVVNCTPGSATRFNSGRTVPQGVHWVLVSVRCGDNACGSPRVVVWEPKPDNSLSHQLVRAFETEFGEASTVVQHTGYHPQDGGWQCGYICAWWYLYLAVSRGLQLRPENLPPPPCGG